MEIVKDKIVLITGAAGGIGLYLCSYFAEAGARLILTDINAIALKEAEKRLGKYSAEIKMYIVDQRNKEEVEKMAADVLKNIGTPDILINNAGIGFQSELADTTYETWQKLMNVNFWGALYFIYAFLPAMKEKQAGHIVNVATGQVFYRLPTWGAYTVTKTALATFTDILRAEVDKEHIKVTTVYPYMVNTGFYKDVQGETLAGKLSMVLLPFYSQSPETVAKIIFNAIIQDKPVEMVSPLNYFGKFMRLVTPANNLIDKISSRSLSKKGLSTVNEDPIIHSIKSATDSVSKTLQKITPPVGFKINEVMSGEHEFQSGFGPEGKFPMEFRVTWGTANLSEWLNPVGKKFMTSELHGTVTIGGLCENANCDGYLQLRYFKDQKIRYFFTFEVNGKAYEYTGEKKQIYPWNLPYSHTTCFGVLKKKGENDIISKSVTHFHPDSMPEFLKSLELVRQS